MREAGLERGERRLQVLGRRCRGTGRPCPARRRRRRAARRRRRRRAGRTRPTTTSRRRGAGPSHRARAPPAPRTGRRSSSRCSLAGDRTPAAPGRSAPPRSVRRRGCPRRRPFRRRRRHGRRRRGRADAPPAAATVDALVAAGLMRLYVPGRVRRSGGRSTDRAAGDGRGRPGRRRCWVVHDDRRRRRRRSASFLPPETARAIYGDPTVVTGGVFAPNGRGHVDGDTVIGDRALAVGERHAALPLDRRRRAVRRRPVPGLLPRRRRRHVPRHLVHVRAARLGVARLLGRRRRRAARAVVPRLRSARRERLADRALPELHAARRRASPPPRSASGGGRSTRSRRWRRRSARSSRSARSPRTRTPRSSWRAPRPGCDRLGRSCSTRWPRRGRRAWPATRSRSSSGCAIRLAGANAAQRAAHAADVAYTLAGGTAVYDTSVLQRLLRDAHVPTQHIQAAPKLFETRRPRPPRPGDRHRDALKTVLCHRMCRRRHMR